MKVYLSGPMTGIPGYNFPAFNAAAADLRQQRYEVMNPAESFGGRTDLARREYLRKDIGDLLTVEGVVLLPGWQRSQGAKLELAIAEALELAVWTYPDLMPYAPERVCDEALRLVYGDRGTAYGHPLDDYTRTSALWTALLASKLKSSITAEDAVRCMIAVKLSRDVNAEKRDNRVDIAGYAECLQRITEERARRCPEEPPIGA